MKSNIKENIGYISIAIVVALTLVLSVVAIDTYQNKDIVANAQVIDGVDYPPIPYDSYELVFSHSTEIDGSQYDYIHYELAGDSSSFVPLPYNLYNVHVFNHNVGLEFVGYFYTSNNYTTYKLNNVYYPVVATFSLGQIITGEFTNYACFIYYDTDNSSYFLAVTDTPGNFDNIDIDIALVPQQVEEDTSTADSFFALMGDGITFGFESISQGITYTMDNLFFEDGSLSDFSIIIFCMTGISLALAVLKYVLNFIFTFGGKN